jgi:hypothetical protein
MNSPMETIRGAVGRGILTRADRLFKNDDAGIWTEVLQNARRAGAHLVEVSIEEAQSGSSPCILTVRDNGRGIEKFQNLLTLGESGWDSAIQAAEDPAGMGFFALCHSEIEIHSGDRAVVIGPSVFLGAIDAQVLQTSEFIEGTRLRFSRASTKQALDHALRRVTEFCPLEVRWRFVSMGRHYRAMTSWPALCTGN